MMHYLVPVYMTYICIEIFSGALRGCGDVRVPTIITVFAVCIMRIVWWRWRCRSSMNFRWWNSATH